MALKRWALVRNVSFFGRAAARKDAKDTGDVTTPPDIRSSRPSTEEVGGEDDVVISTPDPAKGQYVQIFEDSLLGLSIDHDSSLHDLVRIILPTPNTKMRPGDEIIGINEENLEGKSNKQEETQKLLSNPERPLKVTLRSGNAIDILRDGKEGSDLPGRFFVRGEKVKVWGCKSKGGDGYYGYCPNGSSFCYEDSRLESRDFIVVCRMRLEGNGHGFGISFDQSKFFWDSEKACGVVEGRFFGSPEKETVIEIRPKSPAAFDFGKLFTLSIQKHGGHFTFILQTDGENYEGVLETKNDEGADMKFERIALLPFRGNYCVYSWYLFADNDYGLLKPRSASPVLPEGFYEVTYTETKLGVKFSQHDDSNGLFVVSNNGTSGEFPKVNDLVFMVNGHHIHSHHELDPCKSISVDTI